MSGVGLIMTYRYLYKCKMEVRKELYSNPITYSVDFISFNGELSYRDVRKEVISRVPEEYMYFGVLTYEVGEG